MMESSDLPSILSIPRPLSGTAENGRDAVEVKTKNGVDVKEWRSVVLVAD
jgi:hypothetical protein